MPSRISPIAPSRILTLSIIMYLFATVICVRLYMVQIVHGEEYAERADRQYAHPGQSLYSRGTLYFQGKDGALISAATLKSGFTVAINPRLIEDAASVFTALSALIPLNEAEFISKAGKDDPYEEIAKRVSPETAEKVQALGIPGVNIYKDRWRYYPGRELAAQVLGFVGHNSETSGVDGRYGLERYYEDALARGGDNLSVNFFAEAFASINSAIYSRERLQRDLILSIEPSVQAYLGSELERLVDTWSAPSSGGIIIDPKTGEIYAMAVHPDFDLNTYNTERDARVFSNPLVENVFEMGSIMKPLTMAAGLDAGVVNAETTYYDAGFLEMNAATIMNFDGKGRGTVSMQEVLNQSLNTGAAFVARKLGNIQFANYLRAYGLGEETGVDLPGETYGLIGNLESPRDIEYATASYGQGIAVTPIEMARALSALANGGTLITPHVVRETRDELGLTHIIQNDPGARVLNLESASEITRMLVRVVDEALLEGTVKMPNYTIAAKTGTAQIAEPGGGYYEDRYFHTFFGYFPAYNPRFLVFLYVNEPHGVRYASQTLTEPFMNITKFLLNYYEVPPDR